MNRFPRQPDGLAFFAILLGILVLAVIYMINRPHSVKDGFETSEPTPEQLESANTNYAALLLFIQKYPTRSIPFIKDLKDKFYQESCTVKPTLDFDGLAKFPNGMIFV